jgi:putative PEP-CTERM system TPR-repeat lipoprotein
LEAARALEKKQPGNPLTFQLYGAVYLAKNDIASARESFEKSLTLQATYLPALQALARLDVQNGNPGAARKRYETTLAKYPEDAALLLSNAALLRAIGADPREEGALLERALQAAPGVAEPRVALAEHYLRVGDRKKALEVAQQANVVIPNDARIVEALGIAQQANGNVDQAIQTFGQLARLAPNSASVQARLAGAYAAAKDYPRALQILRGAIALDPQRVDLHSDIAAVLVQAGRHDDALAEARALQKQRPKEAAGFIIEADVLAAQQKWRDAATMYRVALGRSADSLTADKAVASLKKLEGSGETSALTGRWLKENPKDLVSHMYLADRAMGQKDYKSAMPHLRILVELQPSNAVLLNNLAWAGAATGDSQAVAHAERAHRLAPTNPFIMDTYGWLLIESGDLKRGVEVLQQAAGLAPGSQEVRLHLAKALLKSGQKDGARKELEAIMRTPGTSTFRDEAASILKTL